MIRKLWYILVGICVIAILCVYLCPVVCSMALDLLTNFFGKSDTAVGHTNTTATSTPPLNTTVIAELAENTYADGTEAPLQTTPTSNTNSSTENANMADVNKGNVRAGGPEETPAHRQPPTTSTSTPPPTSTSNVAPVMEEAYVERAEAVLSTTQNALFSTTPLYSSTFVNKPELAVTNTPRTNLSTNTTSLNVPSNLISVNSTFSSTGAPTKKSMARKSPPRDNKAKELRRAPEEDTRTAKRSFLNRKGEIFQNVDAGAIDKAEDNSQWL